jgi:hypothetical protein
MEDTLAIPLNNVTSGIPHNIYFTSQALLTTPIDCTIGYRVVSPTSSFITPTATGLFAYTASWDDIKLWNHTIEFYFVNHNSTITYATMNLSLNVTANCRRPMTWTARPPLVPGSLVVNHVGAEGFYTLNATSESILKAPLDCKLSYKVK